MKRMKSGRGRSACGVGCGRVMEDFGGEGDVWWIGEVGFGIGFGLNGRFGASYLDGKMEGGVE